MLYAQVHLTLPAWVHEAVDTSRAWPGDEAKMSLAIDLARRNVEARSAKLIRPTHAASARRGAMNMDRSSFRPAAEQEKAQPQPARDAAQSLQGAGRRSW